MVTPLASRSSISSSLLMMILSLSSILLFSTLTIAGERSLPTVDLHHNIDDLERVEEGDYRFNAICSGFGNISPNYQWTFDNMSIHHGPLLEAYLSPGEHDIVLFVTASNVSISRSLHLTVYEVSDDGNTFDTFHLISLVGLIFVILITIALFSYFAFDTMRRHRSRSYLDHIGDRKGGPSSGYRMGSTCDICLKPIKVDQVSVECRCGAVFHRVCGKKEAVCPECGREIMI